MLVSCRLKRAPPRIKLRGTCAPSGRATTTAPCLTLDVRLATAVNRSHLE
ncbi:hypothetical protein PAHAL_2G381300 [Panicum hallii]|uniref:Uncharacterized protein n=1 Tax=Panicum hallii TaxID=206008 RepID=A0A2T8KRV4_9POAL|nr:hypothetical protein PAHAL_2G381300 [Panicum hallii]